MGLGCKISDTLPIVQFDKVILLFAQVLLDGVYSFRLNNLKIILSHWSLVGRWLYDVSTSGYTSRTKYKKNFFGHFLSANYWQKLCESQ